MRRGLDLFINLRPVQLLDSRFVALLIAPCRDIIRCLREKLRAPTVAPGLPEKGNAGRDCHAGRTEHAPRSRKDNCRRLRIRESHDRKRGDHG